MNNQQRVERHGRTVVVGVDGSTGNRSALRYAAEEAAGLGGRVDVVHVVPDYLPISPLVPLTPEDLSETATAILRSALASLEEIAPDAEAEGHLRHGTRAVQLAQAAEEAALLVVGRDDRPLLERLLSGDVTAGVCARASVPVAQVPAGWEPTSGGTVLVGVKSPQHAGELLAEAFAVAHRRGARLVVLHAWRLPSVYDDIIEVRVDLDSWQEEATIEMEALVRDWRVVYPDVPVEIRVVHDRAAHALVEQSQDADVIVLVRREHGVPAAAHLGSTARTVLRSARCPVRVVPPTGTPEVPVLLESEGHLVR
ncbi:universal stress protein [Nocardioides mangrovi]|uniref:Universal stress protein n=1 Tax=Nocardioides mangrovi TaxID=2874580 RepID=A0ABS7U8H9_9ACTN|nr:universal stress protein [Nocardioides mangrovi]MBZ5736962.1 universal stress protein [Nocardioides mangrovi]